ncbi:MAG: hydrogenase expression/formation protein HypE [Planctomycetia bacterium]|nr:hydrogenase expression/formation protein HypE [Planctomycetia bacterium]
MDYSTIQLAHGAGGKLSSDLIEKIFLPRFGNKTLDKLEDQAILSNLGERLAFSTDSFVVDPIFFPGGNIGDLAINGTINDVAMSGAKPLYLSVGFIIEEGLSLEILHKIALSMEFAAKQAGVQIVTGDTKVVNKGSCDKLFINTTGIGTVPTGVNISAANIRPGDKIIISGTVADHGMAVMTTREDLSFKSQIQSDSAALNGLVDEMLNVSQDIRAMRDPTRGGVATTLNEFAHQSNVGIHLYTDSVPVKPEVKGACEVLGIDPLYVANEGKLIVVVPNEITGDMLQTMRKNKLGKDSQIIGEAIENNPGFVVQSTGLGANRIIDMPIGEQLPRIC